MISKFKMFFVIIITMFAGMLFLIILTSMTSDVMNDDDFAPYEEFTEVIGVPLGYDLNEIYLVMNEVTSIALGYDKGVQLSCCEILFAGKNEINDCEGIASFFFERVHEEYNRVTTIEIYYDFQDKYITELVYREGHGKRIFAYEMPIKNNYWNMNFAKLLNDFVKVNSTHMLDDSIEPTVRISIDPHEMRMTMRHDGILYKSKVVTLTN